MRHFYTFLLHGFVLLAPIFSWINPKFAKWLSVRDRWKHDLSQFKRQEGKKLVWFHCASVGEFEQARPIIEGLSNTKFQIVLTFFSPSGYDALNNYSKADLVTYLPTDLPSNVSAFLDMLLPDICLFVKYELWFNFLHHIHQRGIPMALVSAHFPHKHWSTQWPGIHLGVQLAEFNRIFAQSDVTCSRLQSVGINNCISIGDTRIDRVLDIAEASLEHEALQKFCKDRSVLVIGSNWPSDDVYLIPMLKKRSDICVIVAPHELNDAQYKRWKAAFETQIQTISEIESELKPQTRIVYVNQIGLLSKLYRFADVAYIGGGFGRSVHNTLEAAVYGMPVLFGPNNKRFLEVVALKEIGAGTEVVDEVSLEAGIDKALKNAAYRLQVKSDLKMLFEKQRGASGRIVNWVEEKLVTRAQ